MIVEGLARSGSKEASSLAEDIAVRWIRTNYAAYKKTGTMHEKYDVSKCGEFGGGGKYVPQVCIKLFWKACLIEMDCLLL
jgi:alpha,alpha-trehalase